MPYESPAGGADSEQTASFLPGFRSEDGYEQSPGDDLGTQVPWEAPSGGQQGRDASSQGGPQAPAGYPALPGHQDPAAYQGLPGQQALPPGYQGPGQQGVYQGQQGAPYPVPPGGYRGPQNGYPPPPPVFAAYGTAAHDDGRLGAPPDAGVPQAQPPGPYAGPALALPAGPYAGPAPAQPGGMFAQPPEDEPTEMLAAPPAVQAAGTPPASIPPTPAQPASVAAADAGNADPDGARGDGTRSAESRPGVPPLPELAPQLGISPVPEAAPQPGGAGRPGVGTADAAAQPSQLPEYGGYWGPQVTAGQQPGAFGVPEGYGGPPPGYGPQPAGFAQPGGYQPQAGMHAAGPAFGGPPQYALYPGQNAPFGVQPGGYGPPTAAAGQPGSNYHDPFGISSGPRLARLPGHPANTYATAALFAWVLPPAGAVVGVLGYLKARHGAGGKMRSLTGLALSVVVAIGMVLVVPSLLKASDPGCQSFKGTALDAYNQSITDLNRRAPQATLTGDLAAAISDIGTAASKARNVTARSALASLLAQLSTVRGDVSNGSVPKSTVQELNTAAGNADNACGTL